MNNIYILKDTFDFKINCYSYCDNVEDLGKLAISCVKNSHHNDYTNPNDLIINNIEFLDYKHGVNKDYPEHIVITYSLQKIKRDKKFIVVNFININFIDY